MKSFKDWMADQSNGLTLNRDLPDGVYEFDGQYWVDCASCGRPDSVDEHLADIPRRGYRHFCNRSPRCTP